MKLLCLSGGGCYVLFLVKDVAFKSIFVGEHQMIALISLCKFWGLICEYVGGNKANIYHILTDSLCVSLIVLA